MNWARTKPCLSLLDWAVRTSGITLWTSAVLCAAVPSKWQSKPMLPGNWKRLSWGPNGPMFSSGHTVLGAVHRRQKTDISVTSWSILFFHFWRLLVLSFFTSTIIYQRLGLCCSSVAHLNQTPQRKFWPLRRDEQEHEAQAGTSPAELCCRAPKRTEDIKHTCLCKSDHKFT